MLFHKIPEVGEVWFRKVALKDNLQMWTKVVVTHVPNPIRAKTRITFMSLDGRDTTWYLNEFLGEYRQNG